MRKTRFWISTSTALAAAAILATPRSAAAPEVRLKIEKGFGEKVIVAISLFEGSGTGGVAAAGIRDVLTFDLGNSGYFSIIENLEFVAPYGTYSIPGIATPVGEWPVPLFEQIARKNVSLQGVWVSDTRHLWQAIRLVFGRKYPFDKLITHRFPLAQATEALGVMASKEAIKAVLVP